MQAAAESPEAMEQPKVEMTVSKEPGASNATSAETSKVTVAIGKDVTIRFDTQRCIHARHCVTGEPEVFLADTPGEWIFPDRASPERLAIVAHNCPSGAIQIERRDGAPAEAAPPVNLVRLRENGPLAFHADIDLSGDRQGDRVGFRATLCRCGASKNKPFCDGSHIGVDFRASGEPPTRASKPLTVRNGRLLIQPQRNGPLAVVGSVEICAGTGRTIDRVGDTRLCRCGHSADKPFCDGSHGRVGFEASGA
jgi:CDGSH-type Zn-finger protein/uncharacterized Fe-S cluster protein YjdI